MIEEEEDYDLILQRLFKLYPQINTRDVEDALARAFYIAYISGRLQ